MKKLVAENLNEYSEKDNLNSQTLNESILDQYNKLNKNDSKDVKEFVFQLAIKKYLSGSLWKEDAAYKFIKNLVEKTELTALLSFLEKAAADNFAGRTALVYADPTNKTGRKLTWKNSKDLKLQSEKTAR